MNFEFIAHRINTISELRALPEGMGVELDLRDQGERLVLQHDPFRDGENFEDFLAEYKERNTLILNIKSERVELRVLELIQKYQIKKYFFLDSSFPMIFKLASQGEKKIALRFSEFEGFDTIQNMKGLVEWVWVDCFNRFPLTKEIENQLHAWGYRICIVSPELQGRTGEIANYKNYLKIHNIKIDAVCSKINYFSEWIES